MLYVEVDIHLFLAKLALQIIQGTIVTAHYLGNFALMHIAKLFDHFQKHSVFFSLLLVIYLMTISNIIAIANLVLLHNQYTQALWLGCCRYRQAVIIAIWDSMSWLLCKFLSAIDIKHKRLLRHDK